MKISINVNVSGAVRLVHELPQGTSPWATRDDLKAMETRIVAALDDKLAALQQSVTDGDRSITDATARVQATVQDEAAKVADLTQQIAALQAVIDAGGATKEQLDLIDSLKAQVDSQKVKVDRIDPKTPTTL